MSVRSLSHCHGFMFSLSSRSSGVDHDIRWSLLKLGELLFRSDPEPPPKLSIKLGTIPKPAPLVVDDISPTSALTPKPQSVQPIRSNPEPSPLKPLKTKRQPVPDVAATPAIPAIPATPATPAAPAIAVPLPEVHIDAVDIVETEPVRAELSPPRECTPLIHKMMMRMLTFT